MLKRVEFHLNETTRSLLSRTAAVNGASDMRSMVKHLGVNLKSVLAGSRPACEKLSAELGLSADRLILGCKVIDRSRRSEINGHKLEGSSFHSGALRFCPKCVGEDLLRGCGDIAGRSYERLSWTISDINSCVVHGVALATSPEDAGTIRHDFVRCVSSRMTVVEAAIERVRAVAVHPSERYFAERLNGRAASECFLDKFPYFGARNLCLYTGSLKATAGSTGAVRFLSAEESTAALETGFDILGKGEGSFRKFLGVVALNYWKTAAWHPSATVFGNLYGYLKKRQSAGDHDEAIRILRDVAVDVLPLGPEDDFFGPLDRRRLHTVATAARQYGIEKPAVREMLANAGVIDGSHRFKTDAEIVFDADLMRGRLEQREDLVVLKRLMHQTGLEALRYSCIFDKNWPFALLPKEQKPGQHLRYSRAEAQQLLVRMTGRATDRQGSEMVGIRSAARLAGCSLTRLCTMLCEQKIMHLSFNERLGFEGIKVSYKELREKVHGKYSGPLHAEDVAELMEISLASANFLMRDGTLPATEVDASVDQDAYLLLPRNFAVEFTRENIATEALAFRARVSRSRIVADMLSEGILPSRFDSNGKAVFFPRR